MEVRIVLIALIVGLVFFQGIAQDSSAVNQRIIRKGLLRAQGNLSFGKRSWGKTLMAVHGDLEYYLNDKASVRGDSYFSFHDIMTIDFSTFSGIAHHFGQHKNLDPYIGFEPGINISQYNADNSFFAWDSDEFLAKTRITPLASATAGINYYGKKYFHLFLNVRYVHGKLFDGIYNPSMQGIRTSFGLGWNLNLMK